MAPIDQPNGTGHQSMTAVPALIAGHPFFSRHRIVAIIELSGGLNNRLFKVTTDGGQWVCRINNSLDNSTNNSTNNSLAEGQIHQQAAQLGLAPGILHWPDELTDELIIFEFIDGQHLKARHWPESHLNRFAAKLAQLHQLSNHQPPASQWPKLNLIEHIHSYQQRLNSGQQRLNSDQQQQFNPQIDRLVVQLQSLASLPPTLGLCHNDLNALNVIYQQDSGKALIIDWEFGAVGEVFFDLAGFIIEHQLSNSQSERFLHGYFGQSSVQKLSHSEIALKLKIHQNAYRLIGKLWFMLRNE